jgi:hypothetical protein
MDETSPSLKSIRVLVEIRPSTGGTGINISFKEEDPRGNGSLFRIENLSPFPIRLAQDGVLVNPIAMLEGWRAPVNQNLQREQAANGVVGSTKVPHSALLFSDDHAVMVKDAPKQPPAFAEFPKSSKPSSRLCQ